MNFVIDTLPYGQNVTPSEVIDFDKKKISTINGIKLLEITHVFSNSKKNSIYPCHMLMNLF